MYDIKTLSEAVFSKPNPLVVEAYSDYDKEPREFGSSRELIEYTNQKLLVPKTHIHLFLVYPDMGGEIRKRRIQLNSEKAQGHTFRYTWDGWGMISIQLHPGSPQLSGVNANSESRAQKWFKTSPEFGAIEAWNWRVVESHKRRLQRVFKKCA